MAVVLAFVERVLLESESILRPWREGPPRPIPPRHRALQIVVARYMEPMDDVNRLIAVVQGHIQLRPLGLTIYNKGSDLGSSYRPPRLERGQITGRTPPACARQLGWMRGASSACLTWGDATTHICTTWTRSTTGNRGTPTSPSSFRPAWATATSGTSRCTSSTAGPRTA